jgi:O-antigen/teichoic acid export membrane protein
MRPAALVGRGLCHFIEVWKTNGGCAVSDEPHGIRGLASGWWDRLLDVADKRSFTAPASIYAADQTKRDYALNTIGLAAWGGLFPILSVVATQLAGAEQAGMFSMAFTTATLMLYVGNYGVRTYQVSDIDESDSFSSYVVQRSITCVLMLLVCWVWCGVRGYDGQMSLITWGAFGFRAVDAFADAYEARLQQMGKLYLSGMSQAVRAVAGMVVFTLLLLVTHNLVVACLGMALVALASFVLLTIPLTLLETPKSRGVDLLEVKELFVECFPAFAAQFLFALIETMPKFAMEGVLPYESQVYFNAIYFPAQTILMIVGFVYKPQLVRIANVWADRSKRARFDVIVFAMLGVSLAVTLVMLFVFGAVGVWLNGLMYGVDFEPYRTAQYLMIVAGGLSAAIDFLYQIITVLRQQAAATVVYLIAFVVVLVLSMVLVRMVGFDGAVYSYLVVMVALFAMLAVQYALVRLRANR